MLAEVRENPCRGEFGPDHHEEARTAGREFLFHVIQVALALVVMAIGQKQNGVSRLVRPKNGNGLMQAVKKRSVFARKPGSLNEHFVNCGRPFLWVGKKFFAD